MKDYVKVRTTKIYLILMLISLLLFSYTPPTYGNTSNYLIHEVFPNETLWSISKRYKVTIKQIKTINGFQSDFIVPGQAILIPRHSYIVRSGDSLWKIAFLHGMDVKSLTRANNIKDPTKVRAGTVLDIPQPIRKGIMTGAFFVPKSPDIDKQIMKNYRNLISRVGVFEYHPNWNGQLSKLPSYAGKKAAEDNGIHPYAVVTNLSEKGFDSNQIHHLLNDVNARERLISSISLLLTSKKYQGVIIDFERLKQEDRQPFNNFLKKLRKRLHHSFNIAAAVPIKYSDWTPDYHNAYDYRTIGKYVDFVFLMTYDWHWPGGVPGPVAPLVEVKKVLNHAVDAIPRNKILLGIAIYAYDWKIEGNGFYGMAYSQQKAIEIAMKKQSSIRYDIASQAPTFTYLDNNDVKHEVWFEDARSIMAKYNLVKEYNLLGMGGWRLGLAFPQAEYLLTHMFKHR